MGLLAVEKPSDAQALVNELTATLQRRLAVGRQVCCPVEFAAAFVDACASQSCGKCVPCRIGLAQMQGILGNVLDGVAEPADINLLERLAQSVYASADCAIGYEAGAAVLRAVRGFREDFMYHVQNDDCSCAGAPSVPCREGCPAHVDIPGYIALVKAGRYQDAVRLIRKDNPLPLVCGLVCEHPCELGCRRGMVDDPINIRALKRFAVDHAEGDYEPYHYPKTGKRIAVIGGGPAGLTAAYFLALMGHEPTIFEQRAALGGMMRYGIPSYRLPHERLQSEIDWICKQGIRVCLNTNVPADASFELMRQNFDAVYVAIGAHTDKKLGIEGEGAQGVISAVQMLRAIGDAHPLDFASKRIVVVGGGNVAMDCARSAVRLGAAHVTIVYRRRIEDVTAQREEVDGAIFEGCELRELCAPVRVAVEDDVARGLVVQPQIIGEVRGGRPAPRAADAAEVLIPADYIVVAIGQNIEADPFQAEGLPVTRGKMHANKFAQVDDAPGVFVGGDCESGPATVIRAIAAGKAAARNIDAYLGFNHVIKQEVEVPAAAAGDRPACGRSKTAERAVRERSDNFNLMEIGFSLEEAQQEAGRCLRCDCFGMGSLCGGRYPQW